MNAGFSGILQERLESAVLWDSVFFVRTAQCGYEFEQAHAFFPLLPAVLRLLTTLTGLPIVFSGFSGSSSVGYAWSLRAFTWHSRQH